MLESVIVACTSKFNNRDFKPDMGPQIVLSFTHPHLCPIDNLCQKQVT